jgi:hypothetical protein
MAPEQKQALLLGESGGIDERADLYSIGAVLRYHKSIIAPDASWFKVKGDAELSVALDQLIAKAMSPRREDRYSSASEMLREITLLHRFLPAARRLTQESTSELRHHWMLKLQIVAWGLLCLLPAWRAWLAPLGLGLSLGLSIWFSRVRRQS